MARASNRKAARVSQARAAILDRVRKAQRTGTFPPILRPAQDERARGQDPRGRVQHDDALRRFVEELTALGVRSFVEATADAVRARVTEIVAGRSVLSWDLEQLPYDVGRVLPRAATGASSRDVQAAAEVGVTGCDAAIAETGSLVFLSAPGKPRGASLLPPVHLAIVTRDRLRFSSGDFFRERRDDIAAASCCTFVTGPSRTADIELTLTLGVHGPGEVIVIVGP